MKRSASMPSADLPLALYLHCPWCLSKCPYCDFNSHPAGAGVFPQQDYLAALQADLLWTLQRHPALARRPIASVFFGGGTPSLFAPQTIAAILERMQRHLRFAADCEITLEANPGALTREAARIWKSAGVNRVSLGAQSFSDATLTALGRAHDAKTALAACETVRHEFPRCNFDLLFGAPAQSLQSQQSDVRLALGFAPEHLSLYQLTLEPGTPFAKNPPALPDEDRIAAMFSASAAMLQSAGFARYEVSAWAQPGGECRHNLNYWHFGDYLGLGAGAHSKLTERETSGALLIEREERQRDPARYMRQAQQGSGEHCKNWRVEPGELAFEFMLNALRLRDGFALSLFTAHTGLDPADLQPLLKAAEQRGLIERFEIDGAQHLRPSTRGFDFLSDLQAIFLPS